MQLPTAASAQHSPNFRGQPQPLSTDDSERLGAQGVGGLQPRHVPNPALAQRARFRRDSLTFVPVQQADADWLQRHVFSSPAVMR